MFKKGFLINTPNSLSRILDMEVYRNDDTLEEKATITTTIENVSTKEEGFLSDVVKIDSMVSAKATTSATDFSPEMILNHIDNGILMFKDICEQIIQGKTAAVAKLDLFANEIFYRIVPFPDLSLAAIHWPVSYPQSTVQPVHAAMLCNFVARSAGIGDKQRMSLVKAALTANIGMHDVYDLLVNKKQSLSQREISIIQNHPVKSKMLLTRIGIKNSYWLNLILQHHENPTGSGYPMKLKKPKILPEVYIYQIVDFYLSLIRVRAYRRQYTPKEALDKLRVTLKEQYQEVVEKLSHILTRYPPGSMVKLKTGESGVVIKPPAKDQPGYEVAVLLDQDHNKVAPLMRNTNQTDFAIENATNIVLSANIRNECFYHLFSTGSIKLA